MSNSIIDKHIDDLSKVTTTDQLNAKQTILRQYNAITEIQKAEDYDPARTNLAIETLLSMIPTNLRDEEFQADLENAYVLTKENIQGYWCGQPVGEPKWKVFKQPSPQMRLHAITNLFDRLGLWLRKRPKSVFRGKRYGKTTPGSQEKRG